MTDSRKEIELLIKANLKGGRDLGAIEKSIDAITEAIDKQVAAAKRGENAYNDLKASADALRAVQAELAGRGTLIKRFDALTSRVNAQAEAVDKAATKLAEYEKKVGESRTDKQQAQVVKLTASLQALQERLASGRQSLQAMGDALAKAGVDTTKLARAQEATSDQQLRSLNALERLNREFESYSENVQQGRAAAAALAEQQRKLAQLQDGNELDALVAKQQRQLELTRRQTEAEAKLARLRQGNEDDAALGRQQQQELLRRFQKGNETDADLGRQQQLSALARDTGLKQTAADAALTSKEFTTLARASQDLRPRVISLRDAVDSVINPAAKMRETLGGVESQIKAVRDTIASSKGGVADYAVQFKTLVEAQKALQGQASLIDDFRNQTAALKTARTEFVQARGDVALYAAEVRKGGTAGEAFVKPLAEAQTKLRQTALALRQQIGATRESRDALRAAGIDSRNLADAQTRIVEATGQATRSMKALTTAVRDNGEAVAKSGKSFSLFRDEGRTTLSLTQRLRGELLALTATYIGVQGAINLAGDSLKALSTQQGIKSQLTFAFGDDPQLIAQQIQFIRNESERLGISLEQGANGFAKIAASAFRAGAPVGEVQEIFTNISEAARVLRLTPENLSGLFKAIADSFSKGKIQAEELRGQIGDRMPAAFSLAQKALKDIFPDLNKALEDGKVGVENMLLISRSIQQAAQGGVKQAIESMDAAQQRFNNTVFDFKREIAEAGFADAYVKLLKELTEILKSSDGKELAKALSDIASAIVNSISFLVKYREELGSIALVATAMVTAGVMTKLGVGVAAVATAMSAGAASALLFSSVTLSLISGIGPLVAVLFRLAGMLTVVATAGYALGKWMHEHSIQVRQFGIDLVEFLMVAWTRASAEAEVFWSNLPVLAEVAMKDMINRATENFRKLLLIFQVGTKALGLDAMAKGIGEALDILTLKPATALASRTAQIRAQAANDIREIRALAAAQRDEVLGLKGAFDAVPAADRSDNRFGRTRPVAPRTGNTKDTGDAKKQATELAALINILEGLEAKALKKQGDTLQSLLAAVDKETADVERRILAFGGARRDELLQRFRNARAGLKLEITKDYNEKILAEQQTLQDKLSQLEASAGKRSKDELTSRLEGIAKAQEPFLADIQKLREKYLAEGVDTAFTDEIERRAAAATVELQNQERLKFLKEQLVKKEQAINDLINAREISLKRIQEQVVARELTPGQADDASRNAIAAAQPAIAAAADDAERFVVANRAAFEPSRVDEFLLKLAQARNSTVAMNAELDRTGKIIDTNLNQGLDNAFDALYESMGKIVTGAGDIGDAFDSMGRVILTTIAQVLRDLAIMYLRTQAQIQIQLILKAIQGYSGGGDYAGMAQAGVPGARMGMVVGHTRPGTTYRVHPAMFTNAPRYKRGGIPGLAHDEYAAILHKNEEVLTADDGRNVLNGGLKPGAKSETRGLKVVLVDDTRAAMAAAALTPEGDDLFVQQVKRNVASVRQFLK